MTTLLFGGLWLTRPLPRASFDYVGKRESWSEEFPFKETAEVLASGLLEVRGLACDTAGNVFWAEADGDIFRFSESSGMRVLAKGRRTPEAVDQRGLALYGNKLLSAHHARGRIMALNVANGARVDADDLPATIRGPAGIAVHNGTMFVSADLPWPESG